MSDAVNIRKERIERLLKELEYEITRGMLDGEIEEEMGFEFFVPISKSIPNGVVGCSFRTRPITRGQVGMNNMQPRLHLVTQMEPDDAS